MALRIGRSAAGAGGGASQGGRCEEADWRGASAAAAGRPGRPDIRVPAEPGDATTLAAKYPDLSFATKFATKLPLWVNRERARYSTWYELFPRSASPVPGQHGTFADVEAQLPEIASMGFDVLYMPPIHPIGTAYPQGAEQLGDRGCQGTRAAPGRSARRRPRTTRAATKRFIRAWGRLPILTGWRRRRTRTAWNWRSTLRSSARPIIRG